MTRCAMALLALSLASPLPAQQQPAPHIIKWYEAAGAIAGIVGLMFVDEPVRRWAQDVRSETTDDIAAFARHFGQPEVWVTVPATLIAGGLLTKNEELAKAGGRVAASVGLAIGVELTIKLIVGRTRPDSGLGAFHFDPFSVDANSMPSGHSAIAWALMTSLAHEVKSPVAQVGFYGLASATAWSRVNDDRHWLSDVVAGSLIGFTSAKLVHGKWQVWGIKPPAILVSAEQTTVSWSFAF
jgi:membrane-associated phospholipid phosphatase